VDVNKLEVLTQIGFTIRGTCRSCVHARGISASGFGTCNLRSYFHLKHQEERPLSIHEQGWCPDYSVNEVVTYNLAASGMTEFMEADGV
jgi:hypothetical protein